ncbi:UDP-N-acetylmuramoyl-tripeptide--D-alanyl-D-alanine ligase [soil metagenome]
MSIYKPTGIKKAFHDTRRTLAKRWLSFLHPIQIAITGSQGKTGTTAIITALAKSLGPTITTDINLDTTFNVPITALKVRPHTKFLIWELGIDHPGEMAHHLEIARPTISVITGISPVHTDDEHMGSLQTLIAEKQKIIEILPSSGDAILNADNEYVQRMAPATKATIHWYGSQSGQTEVYADPQSIHLTLDGTKAIFHDTKLDMTFEVTTGLIGKHHVSNLMAGYLMFKLIEQNKLKAHDLFKKIVAEFKPLRGRMSIEQGPLETLLLNDSLRANPESTKLGLESLNEMEHQGRKIAVIGEMGELEKPEEEHRETGKQLANMKFDYVICIGPLRKYTIETAIQHGFPKENILYATDVFEAATILKDILKHGDLWYLKGSLLRNYKRIVQLLNGEDVCCHRTLCPYDHCGY